MNGSSGFIDFRQEDEGCWAIRTRSLRLPFRWDEDRWNHLFVIGSGGQRRSFADSLEQSADHPDPATIVSPVFQDIGFQNEPDGSVLALLVGQHGSHHFSASFRVTTWESPGDLRTSVEVDVADRCRTPIAAVSSTYQVHSRSSALLDAGSNFARWSADPDAYTVELTVEDGEPGASVTRPSIGLAEAGRSAILTQILAPVLEESSTRRWKYRWTFTQPSPSFSLPETL